MAAKKKTVSRTPSAAKPKRALPAPPALAKVAAKKPKTSTAKAGASTSAKKRAAFRALSEAVEAANATRVKELLEAGAHPDSDDEYDVPPIYHAAIEGLDAIAALLLAHDADFEVCDDQGCTPLYIATVRAATPHAKKGHLKVVELLLRASADPDRETDAGVSPRQRAKSKALAALFAKFPPRNAQPVKKKGAARR